MSLVDLFVCFRYTVIDFLRNRRLKTIKSFLSVLKLGSVVVPHGIDLSFEFLAKHAQFVLKLGTEGLKRVIDSLGFSLREVAIGLNLALNVLELGFQLLFRLDSLHQHDVVVAVHLDQLIVHRCQGHVLVLLAPVACHVLLNELLFGRGHLGLHHCVAGGYQRARSVDHLLSKLTLSN